MREGRVIQYLASEDQLHVPQQVVSPPMRKPAGYFSDGEMLCDQPEGRFDNPRTFHGLMRMD
jgi:hypothetical protein